MPEDDSREASSPARTLRARIVAVREGIASALASADSPESLEGVRLRFSGRKDGELNVLLKGLKDLSLEERREFGPELNALKKDFEERLARRDSDLREALVLSRIESARVDATLPGTPSERGRRHPLTQTADEIARVLLRLGFSWAEGPHVESDYYNFWALNFPKDHPALDSQDTFYVRSSGTPPLLLRTHTSPVQVRALESRRPPAPVRIFAPGKVFRHENADASHSSVFHQIEGLFVDRGVSMADLKGTLQLFLQGIFGPDTRMRLRPSFFPFTEPSAQVDIQCSLCRGLGCPVCKRLGWLEVIGAGMVHPNVLRNAGYDPEAWSGYAWGLGVERIAMMRMKVHDIRLFYQNDVRFLEAWP
jgi:phenylalanyl-tRNA synthetase alpha chain